VSRKQEDKGLTYLVLAALMIMVAVALGGCGRPAGESLHMESCDGEVTCETAGGSCTCNTEGNEHE
jgi:hypothetical protein